MSEFFMVSIMSCSIIGYEQNLNHSNILSALEKLEDLLHSINKNFTCCNFFRMIVFIYIEVINYINTIKKPF